MPSWEHTAVKHVRRGEIMFQVNIPKQREIPEFEIVAMKNGLVVDRAVGWDSHDSHLDLIDHMSVSLEEAGWRMN